MQLNSMGGKKDGAAFQPSDFFGYFPTLANARQRQTMEEQIAIWRSIGARVTQRSDNG
ncbi:MAG TPA: hypothetical protein VF158_04360 [Longimicrobiales bacterium]